MEMEMYIGGMHIGGGDKVLSVLCTSKGSDFTRKSIVELETNSRLSAEADRSFPLTKAYPTHSSNYNNIIA